MEPSQCSSGKGRLAGTGPVPGRFPGSPVLPGSAAGPCRRSGSCGMLVAKQPVEVELPGYCSQRIPACIPP